VCQDQEVSSISHGNSGVPASRQPRHWTVGGRHDCCWPTRRDQWRGIGKEGMVRGSAAIRRPVPSITRPGTGCLLPRGGSGGPPGSQGAGGSAPGPTVRSRHPCPRIPWAAVRAKAEKSSQTIAPGVHFENLFCLHTGGLCEDGAVAGRRVHLVGRASAGGPLGADRFRMLWHRSVSRPRWPPGTAE